MIIKQTRIKAGGAGNVIAHVNRTDQNEICERLFGDEDILDCDDQVASDLGRKYSVRHFSVSPDQELTDDQVKTMVKMIGKEFDFTDREVALYRHVKERANGNRSSHFHILVSEQNKSGRTMSNRANYARNEKLARAMELRFGHKLTKGAHNRAVYAEASKAAPEAALAALEPLTEGPRPVASFGSKSLAKAKRLGVDLPAIVQDLEAVRGKGPQEVAQQLRNIEATHNVHFQKGDRRNVILLKTEAGEDVFSANKALKITAKDVSAIIAAKERADASLHEDGARQRVEANRRDPRGARPGGADKELHLRSGGPAEQRGGSRPGGSDRAAERAAGEDRRKSNRHDGINQSQHGSPGRADRGVQLTDPGGARSKLRSAHMRKAATKAEGRMRFGNGQFSSSQADSSGVPSVMPYGGDAEDLLRAWAASMQASQPRM